MSTATIAERTSPFAANWRETLDAIVSRIRVAIPGIIQSFNAATQTVTVQPAITENVAFTQAGSGVWQETLAAIAIPVLADVPIVIPRAGGFALTLPVQQGDECLIVFGDSCFDAWWQNGGVQNQVEERRHDLSDAFAILGCWNQKRVLSNYSTTAAQLRSDDGQTVVEVGAGEVTIKAGSATINISGTATVQGNQVNVTGSSKVVISGNNQTTIDGKDFLLHMHTGVATGGGTSGPVA